MRKMNKKGFTIVELVIVIAVIAILAAVMIPTFSGIIGKANDSSALQEARTAYTAYVAEFDYTSAGTPSTNLVIGVDTDATAGADKFVIVVDGQMVNTVYTTQAAAKTAIESKTSKTATVSATNVTLKDSDAFVYVVTLS